MHFPSIGCYKFLDHDKFKALIVNEADALDRLESYVMEQQTNINILKSYVHNDEFWYTLWDVLNTNFRILTDYKEMNAKSHSVDGKYFENPINAFIFTKRLVVGWRDIEKYVSEKGVVFGGHISWFLWRVEFVLETLSFKNSELLEYLSEDNLTQAAEAFFTLQRVYKLRPSDLVKGEIRGLNYK